MRAQSIRLGPWHQAAVYGATGVLAVSGIVWLVLHYFLALPGEYGPQIHPLELWLLGLGVPGLLLWHVVSGRARTWASAPLPEPMESDA
ncbi:MAG: hypothetical protein ABI728_09225 [Betaproteobacteria bacterium]